jgi:hypothetical protein
MRTFHKNLANLGHFLQEKSFVKLETIFFKSKFGKNSPIKEIHHV